MKRTSLAPLALSVVAFTALVGIADHHPVEACSYSHEVVARSLRHPDLPVSPYVAGHLGVIEPTYARLHLAVAYLYLTGKGIEPAARPAVLRLYQKRLAPVEEAKVAPGLVAPTAPDSVAEWDKERARVLAAAPASSAQAGQAGQAGQTNPSAPSPVAYTSASFTSIDNCLLDAFRMAKDTLLDRESKLSGAKSVAAANAELVEWVRAQDVVFSNCPDPKKKAVPAALPANATAQARADRAYQRASAFFYSEQWDDAEKGYRAIAADKASPWSKLARYMMARVMVRRATVGRDTADAPELSRALGELDAQLRDADLVTLHPSVRNYRHLVRMRRDQKALLPEVAARLSAGATGTETGALLEDYTVLVDFDEDVLAKGPASDDLTAFVGTVQGKRSFDFAMTKHAANPSSEAWLVAALMTATRATDARVPTLISEGLAVPPTSAAYATARFHSLRLSAARGESRAVLTDLLQKTRVGLGTNSGLSTRNAFTRLAASIAPDLPWFLREAAVTPAGVSEEGLPVVYDPALPKALPPELTEALSAGLPLAVFKDATLSPVLSRTVRAPFAATTWTRALLLGDRATASAVAQATSDLNPALKPFVDRVEHARNDPERRLAVLHALLSFPSLGPALDAWAAGPSTRSDVYSSSAGHFWCAPTPITGASSRELPAFLSTADREAAKKEVAALAKLGTGPTWLGFEAAQVAKLLPKDPRSPEVLHLAVRATRFGCKDGKTTEASKAAFLVLHRQYPGSSWAKSTPYYF
jgi:hypothetical protein